MLIEVEILSDILKASHGDTMHLDIAKAKEMQNKGIVKILPKKGNKPKTKAYRSPPKNRMMQPVEVKSTWMADYRQKKNNTAVICVIPIHGRKDITEKTVSRLLNEQDEKITIILVGDSEAERQLAYEAGVIFVGYWNSPLGWKLQAGIREARKRDPEAIMISGSDDYYSSNWISKSLQAIRGGADFVGGMTYHFWNQLTGNVIHWTDDHFGAGELISARALNALEWRIYDNTPIEKKLDSQRRKALMQIGIEKQYVRNITALGIRGEWDTLHSWHWGFEENGTRYIRGVTSLNMGN